MKKLLIITVLMMTASTSLFSSPTKENGWINLLNNFIGIPDAVNCTAVNQGNISALDQAKLMIVTKGDIKDQATIEALSPTEEK